MFVGILLRDPARDFGVEFESLRHREISVRRQKTIGSHVKNIWKMWVTGSLLTMPFIFRSTSVMAALVQDLDVIVLLVVPGKMYSPVIKQDAMESLD